MNTEEVFAGRRLVSDSGFLKMIDTYLVYQSLMFRLRVRLHLFCVFFFFSWGDVCILQPRYLVFFTDSFEIPLYNISNIREIAAYSRKSKHMECTASQVNDFKQPATVRSSQLTISLDVQLLASSTEASALPHLVPVPDRVPCQVRRPWDLHDLLSVKTNDGWATMWKPGGS